MRDDIEYYIYIYTTRSRIQRFESSLGCARVKLNIKSGGGSSSDDARRDRDREGFRKLSGKAGAMYIRERVFEVKRTLCMCVCGGEGGLIVATMNSFCDGRLLLVCVCVSV